MERKPQRYGKRQLLGWKAYKAWSPIGVDLYSDSEAAKLACAEHCGQPLQWEVSVRTPEGHPSWSGAIALEGRSASHTYQASPHAVAPREDVPNAEFVSPDDRCNVYIAPEGDRWAVYTMVDLEGSDPFWVMHMTGGSSEQEGKDAAKLWNIFQFASPDKKVATSYARYIWGRALVRGNSPPPVTTGKLRERLRNWAVKWL